MKSKGSYVGCCPNVPIKYYKKFFCPDNPPFFALISVYLEPQRGGSAPPPPPYSEFHPLLTCLFHGFAFCPANIWWNHQLAKSTTPTKYVYVYVCTTNSI